MAQGLEGSQTSPRRLKLREATSGKPLWPDRRGNDVSLDEVERIAI